MSSKITGVILCFTVVDAMAQPQIKAGINYSKLL